MLCLGSFFARIMKDVRQKKLIPLKILFFVHASTVLVLYPYLTIHMRELGINVEETAIMSAVTPVVSIVMPPLAGMLADKIGNFRLLLALSSAIGGVSALLLMAVPVGRITITFPPSAEVLVSCESSAMRLQQLHDYPCSPLHPYSYDVNLTILSCGFTCELPPDMSAEEEEAIIQTHSYDINLMSKDTKPLVLYRHTVSNLIGQHRPPKKDQSTSRILTNNQYFNTTVSKVSDGEVFFPAPQLYRMECFQTSENATCSFDSKDIYSELEVNEESKFRVRVSRLDLQQESGVVSDFLVKAISTGNTTQLNDDSNAFDSLSCVDNLKHDVRVHTNSRKITKCRAACAALTPRKSLCENPQQKIDIDPVFTFWTYLAVRVFISIISGTAFAMFEGAVIAIVRDQRADYGLQRVYGSIGGMISSPLSGLLIDYASRGKGYTDFRPAFYLYAVLKVASGALMLGINLEFKQPAQNILEDVITVFRNIEIVALFIACFIMGTAWGYIESFLFWLLQDMGASRSLMGITITVGGIAGVPLLVLSGPIIKKLGHANVIFIGFVFYAIRLLGYSLIYDPWLCLVFEALESVTSSLAFTAAVTYAARLSSITTDTSVQGLLGGLYYGVGKGSGSLIGGYLMKFFGTRPTYQIFSTATFITGCIYFLFNRFYIRKRAMGDENDLCKKKPPTLDVEGCDTIKDDKITPLVDGVDKTGIKVKNVEDDNDKPVQQNQKANNLRVDNTDGSSSDSGVDNPAYNETENVSTSEPKKHEVKTTGL